MNYKKIVFVLFFVLLAFIGCKNSSSTHFDEPELKIIPKYAKGFYITKSNGFTEAYVKDPWDSTKILAHYVFVPKNERNSINVHDAIVIKTPCTSVACLSSPEIGFISRLGLTPTIAGVSQIEYIKDALIIQQVSKGKTQDLGPFEAYNVELLMAINPNVLFAAPFKDDKYGKIKRAGIPIAYCASYMEESPLGRAEWIKFIALFYNQYEAASTIFDSIEKKYNQASEIANKISKKPTVFSGKMFQNTWFVSGKNTYMTQFFTDAGAKYVWDDLSFSGSEPISFERVYNRCSDVDYWVVLEYAPDGYSYKKLRSENQRYAHFDAFKRQQILFCNTQKTAYYEKGIIEPDVILKDFIKLFHPALMEDYQPVYFQKLADEKQ